DRRRAEQQRDEVQHGQHLAVALVPGEEHPDEDAGRRLHQPGERHHQEGHPQRVRQAGVGEHLPPARQPRPPDLAQPVPGREAERQDPDQRDHAEGDEHREGRQCEPAEAAAGRSPAGGGLRRQGGARDPAHLPMTAFMLSTNCCGEIDSWNSLAMLSSSTSAAVGLSAWSQDWANDLALLAMPYTKLRNSASLEFAKNLSTPLTIGTPPVSTQPFCSSSSSTPVAKNFLAISFCSGVAA